MVARVFVDSSILIHWIRKNKDFYSAIEKIRVYSCNSPLMLELSVSPAIMCEILSGKNGSREWKEIKDKWLLKETMDISTHLLGSKESMDEVQNNILNKAKEKHCELFRATNDKKDTFHYSTAENMEDAHYFLVVDKRFSNKMNNEARKISKKTKIVTPNELLDVMAKLSHR